MSGQKPRNNRNTRQSHPLEECDKAHGRNARPLERPRRRSHPGCKLQQGWPKIITWQRSRSFTEDGGDDMPADDILPKRIQAGPGDDDDAIAGGGISRYIVANWRRLQYFFTRAALTKGSGGDAFDTRTFSLASSFTLSLAEVDRPPRGPRRLPTPHDIVSARPFKDPTSLLV